LQNFVAFLTFPKYCGVAITKLKVRCGIKVLYFIRGEGVLVKYTFLSLSLDVISMKNISFYCEKSTEEKEK